MFTPSKYQAAIFDWIENGSGDGIVGAVAGSGKTTTIDESTRRLPYDARRSTLVIAYNKHIADAMKKRVPEGVNVSTIHALGMKALRGFYQPKDSANWLDADKYRKLCRYYWSVNLNAARETDNEVLCRDVVRFCMVTLTDPEHIEALIAMCDRYGIDVPPASEEIVFKAAAKVLEWGREGLPTPDSHGLTYHPSQRIAFDDMIYLPNVVSGCNVERFRWVLCDECQDLSAAQLGIALAARMPGGRCMFVGDPNQAIYAFSGADAASYENIKARTSAVELPLSVCYRCPETVVARARELQPQIECAPGAPVGVVQDVAEESAKNMIRPGDMVICRVNAPLIGLAFGLIRRGIGATILGRDIAANLTRTMDAITKMILPGKKGRMSFGEDSADRFEFDRFHEFAEEYRDAQLAVLARRKDADGQIIALNDRVDALRELYTWCTTTRGSRTIADLRSEIDRLFENRSALVTLSSIHKAKGSEANRVFLFKPHLLPHPMAKTDDALIQENNLKYVAITRAKSELYFARDSEGEKAQESKKAVAQRAFDIDDEEDNAG